MSRTDDPARRVKTLAGERKRVLDALRGEALTGPAILRRMSEPPTAAEAGSAGGAKPGGARRAASEPADASLLYPALHSLEADWRLEAAWLLEAGGVSRRTYRKRRLVPHFPLSRPGRGLG
jgi:hypothetical protein